MKISLMCRVNIYIAIIMAFSGAAYAEQSIRFTSEVDTPTAYTIGRGNYHLSLFAYDEGGVNAKTFIGLHDNFYLGASCDIAHAIGKQKPEPNVPGVVGKIKFTDGWERFPISVAVGYDTLYLSTASKTEQTTEEDKLNRMYYGPFFVITKPVYLLDSEQHISGGIRVPTQPHFLKKDTSYFLSFDIPMGDYFCLKWEWERVYYNFHRHDDWLYNTGLRYSYMKLGVEFDFIMQRHERINRIIKVEYTDAF